MPVRLVWGLSKTRNAARLACKPEKDFLKKNIFKIILKISWNFKFIYLIDTYRVWGYNYHGKTSPNHTKYPCRKTSRCACRIKIQYQIVVYILLIHESGIQKRLAIHRFKRTLKYFIQEVYKVLKVKMFPFCSNNQPRMKVFKIF